VNVTNPNGGTAIRAAAEAGHAEIIRVLLARKARPNVRDKFGKLPVDYAKDNGHTEAVQALQAAR
jgi:uncharacterized protein